MPTLLSLSRGLLPVLGGLVIGACARSRPAAEVPAPAPTPAPAPAPAPAGAPAPDGGGTTAAREYSGSYTSGWEASWFAPCNAPVDDALWWVTLTDQALVQRDSLLRTLKQRPTGALAVRWRGTISPRMPSGMMGRGTRYLLVTDVLEVKPLPSAGACPPPSRTT